MIPPLVVETRRDVCSSCPHPCVAYRDGSIDHSNPQSECPVKWERSWGSVTPIGESTVVVPIDRSLPPAPSLIDKVKRLAAELRRWRKAGYKIASRSERDRRVTICNACPHYDPSGNWGLGQCRLCGCTKAKLWLATSHCPHPDGPKWKACNPH